MDAGTWRASCDSTAPKSIPPLRKMPSGTSLIVRRRTASDRRCVSSSTSRGSSLIGKACCPG